MLLLSLVWLAAGALLGLIARAARLAPGRRWQASLLGALVALGGGWLATLLLDQVFATCAALWLCVAAVVGVGLLARRSAAAGARR